MKQYTLYQIDSFTKTRFKGNPAGVVLNADGLSDDQMQKIAGELNNSETAFLFRPDGEDCDGVIRYFTPATEVPLCGHATIAAMYAKADEEGIEGGIFNMKTKVGVLPFEIRKSGGDMTIGMTQGEIVIQDPLAPEYQKKLLACLGISFEDLAPGCPVQIVSTGHAKVMIGIKSNKKLNSLKPDFSGLAQLSKEIDCNGYYVFNLNPPSSKILTQGRMFAPAVGIREDPVTGNAHGPLGAYLVHNQLVDTEGGSFVFTGAQGEAIGREGLVEVSVAIKEKRPVLVKIAGEAVVVFKTFLEI